MQVTYQQLADMTGLHKNTIIARLRRAGLTFQTAGPGFPKFWRCSDALRAIFEAEFKQSNRWFH